MTISFFVEVKGDKEAVAFGSISGEINRWVAFEGSPIGDCYLG
jgi:hypothetical protein